jgi:hypothetical protein
MAMGSATNLSHFVFATRRTDRPRGFHINEIYISTDIETDGPIQVRTRC